MARELTRSEQARRAGLWEEVRPEALVPKERDPVSGSLRGQGDSDGRAKDRRTESSRSESPSSSTSAPRFSKGRWGAVTAAGAVALVLGVGGAVALANRDTDATGSGPGSTGAADPGATATTGGGPGSASPTPTGPVGPQDRSYEGTMTSTSGGADALTSETSIGVVCTETECFVVGWSLSGRRMSWPAAETTVTGTLPKIGEVTNICEGAEPFAPEAEWALSVTDDALRFTVSDEEETAPCADGGSAGAGGSVIEFDGKRVR